MFNNLKKIVITGLLVSVYFNGFSEETTEEKKKEFPGKVGIEFGQIFQSAGSGNKVVDTEKAEAALYSRTEFKGKLDFVLAKFYSITPWIKDRVDIYYDPVISSSKVDASDDTTFTKTSASSTNLKGRNRFEVGIENTFTAADVIKVNINPAFRFENSLNKNINDWTEDNYQSYTQGAAAKFVFFPTVTLGYAYKAGLAWSIINTAYVNFFPVQDQVNNDSIFESVDHELTVDVGFNVLKPLKVDNYSLTVFVNEYTFSTFYTDNYQREFSYDGDDFVRKGTFKDELKGGVRAGIYDFTLVADSYSVFKTDIDNFDKNGADIWTGLQLAAEFRKNGWSVGAEYTGVQQLWLASIYNDDGEIESRQVKSSDNKYWENTIEAYIKYKF